MKPLRPLEVAFCLTTSVFLLSWLPALFGCRAARLVFVLCWPVVAGLALVVALRRSP
ncbi:hypothetical protein JQX13_38800 [Archangium violaceum]|uniref:hypothetical protein n=1 Tax=Archangium violaceum TaxID=83451 RepID=UPI00193AFC7B|nr:hypothetical protein [Archangium violaceum]QRK06033.1 hypothetical protein JQX13_38800 [Archangium violaceum]